MLTNDLYRLWINFIRTRTKNLNRMCRIAFHSSKILQIQNIKGTPYQKWKTRMYVYSVLEKRSGKIKMGEKSLYMHMYTKYNTRWTFRALQKPFERLKHFHSVDDIEKGENALVCSFSGSCFTIQFSFSTSIDCSLSRTFVWNSISFTTS